ncbi:MAG: NAD(P)H-hydrate epimerase [Candidatus Nanohaloarchaea archaeon]|nr:NAD(P)H-hydrate epimerase [Candidatus Nanohaloarchaea archaeon]
MFQNFWYVTVEITEQLPVSVVRDIQLPYVIDDYRVHTGLRITKINKQVASPPFLTRGTQVGGMTLPVISVDQMRTVDEVVPDEYGITVSRMMENAGYQLAAFVRQEVDAERVHVYAGAGNNGGDGLAAARRLHLWGYDVAVMLASDELNGIREEELAILRRLDVPVDEQPEEAPDVIIDALIGYSLDGNPRPPFDGLIDVINESGATVVSVDVPSGVDAETGEEKQPHVHADYTVTLALPFDGFDDTDATGEVWVADISVPPAVYDRFGVDARAVFRERSLVPYR